MAMAASPSDSSPKRRRPTSNTISPSASTDRKDGRASASRLRPNNAENRAISQVCSGGLDMMAFSSSCCTSQ